MNDFEFLKCSESYFYDLLPELYVYEYVRPLDNVEFKIDFFELTYPYLCICYYYLSYYEI